MEKHLIVCDRCRKEVSPQDRVRLTHDANDEHPSYLAMNLASNMDLCVPCSTAFVEWMRSAPDKLLAFVRRVAWEPIGPSDAKPIDILDTIEREAKAILEEFQPIAHELEETPTD